MKDRAVNSATNGIAFTDLEGNVTFTNPCALKMWGFAEESEVLHKPLRIFFLSEQEALAASRSTVGEVGRSRRQESVLRPAHILRIRPEAVSIEAEDRLAHFE